MSLRWVRQEWDEEMTNGASPSAETQYQVVTDDADGLYSQIAAEADLRAYLASIGAMTYGNLPLMSVKVKRLKASKCFQGFCSYGMRDIPTDGKFDFTMDCRPEQRRMFMGLDTIASYAPTGYVAANRNGLLNVTSDLQADGADVFIPVDTMNLTGWWALSRFVIGQSSANYQSLQNYVNLIETLLGKVNSTTFTITIRGLTWTYLAGECLFASRRLSQQASDLWQVDFEFRVKRSYVDPVLSAWNGSAVTIQGCDEVDFQTKPVADSAAIALSAGAFGAQVKRKYFRGDLNLLKVPSPP